MFIISHIYYGILLSLNTWVECDKPEWLFAANPNIPLDAIRYVKGGTFIYKLVGTFSGQGGNCSHCYRKFRKHVLKKRSGLI
jgi:hypothetical protein